MRARGSKTARHADERAPIMRSSARRASSAEARRRKAREGKELHFYGKQGGTGEVVESVGPGYFPPHQMDTRKMIPGKAYALYKAMANLDRGI